MICHHFNCVFVHIPKAAGQSVEQVFIKALDLTWDTRAPLLLRTNDNSALGPRSLAHLTAQEYVEKKYMTPEQFSRYFKFTFVRNPYARLVSTYVYFDYIEKFEFKNFLEKIVARNIHDRQFIPQTQFIQDSTGNMLVDFVGRFENLQKDFDHVTDCVGLPRATLPHANKTIVSKTNPGTLNSLKNVLKAVHSRKAHRRLKTRYMDYFDAEAFALANSLYTADFKTLGYEVFK